MASKEKKHSYVICIALVYALLPYDYIIKVVGNMSLSPILLFLTLVLCLMHTTRIRIDTLNAAVLSLALIYDISIFWSRGNHIVDGISFSLVLIVFVMLRSLELTPSEIEFIETFAMLGAASLFLYIVITGGGISALTRLSGRLLVGNYYSDPNGIAGRQFLGLTIAIKRIIQEKRLKNKALPIMCMLLSFVVFVLAASRGSYVAFAVFILIIIMGQLRNRSHRLFQAVGIILLLIILFSVTYEVLPERVQMKLSMTLYRNGGTDISNGRSLLWSVAITKLLPKMPFWGYGISGTTYQLGQYLGFQQTVHNTFLQCLLEMGYLGCIAFIVILVNTYQIIKKQNDAIKMAIFAGVITIVFFLSAFEVKYLWMTLLYCSFQTTDREAVETK